VGAPAAPLDERMIEFIRRQEMLLVMLAGGARSSRSGPEGFIRVPSRRLIAWPEFGSVDSLGLSLSGPVRLLLLDLFKERAGLHLMGWASLAPFAPPALCGPSPAAGTGPRPDFWVRVRVDRAHFAE